MNYFVLTLLAAGVVSGMLALLLLQKMVLSRLTRLSANVKSIGSRGNVSERVAMPGMDGVSVLAGDINRILDELERSETERQRLEAHLRMAQKMEAVGQLAGGVAHEFNNLHTVIIGYSHVGMTEPPAQVDLHRNLREIQKAAQRASNLTHQLLTFSRRQVIVPKVFNLNDLILNTDKMLRRLITKDIELVILPAPDLGMVKMDPGQMEQTLVNLVVNARDAMINGGKLVIETANFTLDDGYARQHPETTAGRYVMLSVKDTGTGMTDEVKAHIFEPFFSTKEDGKRTGLGLSTCHGIVAQSGGHISVYSDLGEGTTFRIYLPRVDEGSGSLLLEDDPGYLPNGTETILLVEDEPSVRGITYQVLREQGYTLLEAENGADALRMVEEHGKGKIDLLLTDIIMPLMGGTELAERLRERDPEIKVLFTSGYTDDGLVRPDVLEGGTEFMQKPFTPAILARKVREVLDSQ